MSQVILFGNSEFIEMVYEYLREDSDHEVVAFTVDKEYVATDEFLGLPLVAFEDIDKTYPPDEYRIFIPMSYRGMNRHRAEKYAIAKSKGYNFISYVSSSTKLWGKVDIGENCYIQDNCIIHSGVSIGNNVMIGGSSFISHHSVINDHCFFAGNDVLGGLVTIEAFSVLGLSVTIKDHVNIGEACFLNAGTLITRNTNAKEVYEAPKPVLRKISSDKIRF